MCVCVCACVCSTFEYFCRQDTPSYNIIFDWCTDNVFLFKCIDIARVLLIFVVSCHAIFAIKTIKNILLKNMIILFITLFLLFFP